MSKKRLVFAGDMHLTIWVKMSRGFGLSLVLVRPTFDQCMRKKQRFLRFRFQ